MNDYTMLNMRTTENLGKLIWSWFSDDFWLHVREVLKQETPGEEILERLWSTPVFEKSNFSTLFSNLFRTEKSAGKDQWG